ncbi:NAD+ synthase (glutamine-hydrolysing) [Halopolyspora algeriensis]|uniref:Glutamine-dependent NAD(+) synthetase n=1 Tax=Halopolyspora algeriensis TaxID=1500506 RepID=A0A368VHH6_9ACTN|nr:NAD+ synthase [Halopolyspora algeriensis]RCW40680.1 NAD+ synthase (glutamine-hydrolysing) [Halopolyspora algeriensis]TQM53397.1 NAD+ synthase (glutamine-hydrolysing) [Halopolyspora algeriensis]
MPQLRVALAQVNACAGDITGNSAMVLDWTRRAVQEGAHLVAFPEMVLSGYPVEDLALRKSFAAANRSELDALARRLLEAGCGDALVVVGHLDRDDEGVRNAASLLYGGEVVATYYKHHLPNYGVFDEARYFAPGHDLPIVRLHGVDIGVVICEDIWRNGGPVAALGRVGVDAVVCLNGSPYERTKNDQRTPLVTRRAAEAGAPMAYVNMVGAQDELVFDGGSLVATSEGEVQARAPQFVEHLMVLDMDLAAGGHTSTDVSPEPVEEGTPLHFRPDALPAFGVERIILQPDPLPPYEPLPPPRTPEPLPEEAEVWSALVTGLRDYVHKNGFPAVTFGFSGGIDSAVCAALAADALGPDALYGVSMPSKYSTEHSRSDAADLAQRLGCHYEVHPVADMVEVFVDRLQLSGVAEENVQARCRGITLMSLSNQLGRLVLTPGNKTELAVGYSTIYGDSVGGFAPIKDVPKTLVWRLARWRNAEAARHGETPPIPESSISKAPSAELRPDQVDTDSLPPYETLDEILDGYVEGDRSYADLVAEGFDADLVERVLQMVDRSEYKRRQYPPGSKITFKAFGRDRRLPITNRWREVRP